MVHNISYIVALAGGLFAADVASGGSTTLEEIMTSWHRRQDFVESAQFTWSIKRTFYPGGMRDMAGQPWPDQQETFVGRNLRFAFDRGRFAYHYYPVNQGLPPDAAPDVITYDGESLLSITPSRKGSYTQALYAARPFTDLQNFNIWPFLLNFRPFGSNGVDISPVSLKLLDETESINGRQCLILRWQQPTGYRKLFIDPAAGYQVARFEDYRYFDDPSGDTFLNAEIDISYKAHDANVWVPQSWRIAFRDSKKVCQESVADLTDYSVNQPLTAKEFDLAPFPVGTLVLDRRSDEKSWQGENGTLTPITTGRSQPAAAWQNSRFVALLVLNGAALLVIVAVSFLVRRWRAAD